MYLDDTVCRINRINWGKVGTVISNEDAALGCEFLRRLALFYKNEGLKPQPPLFTNVAKLLGDTEGEFPISMYCHPRILEFVADYHYLKKIIEFTIQLSMFVEKKQEHSAYLNVYEPLIRILERGGFFVLRPQELEIHKIEYISLNGWYDRFLITEF